MLLRRHLERVRQGCRWALALAPIALALVIVLGIVLEQAVARLVHAPLYNMTTGCPLDQVCNDATRLWVYDQQRFAVLALLSCAWALLLALGLALLGGAAYGAQWLWRERRHWPVYTTPAYDDEDVALSSEEDDYGAEGPAGQ